MHSSTNRKRRRHEELFLTAMMLTIALPLPVHALDILGTVLGETVEEPTPPDPGNFLEVQQTLNQLMQRFATLEVSIESRLNRLTDSSAKGDALLEVLSMRLGKVDDLVEKVEALDSRLTEETSLLKATLRDTNRDLQNVASHLERLDSEVKEEDISRHETRSNWPSRAPTDAELLNTMVMRRFGEIERSVPRLVNEVLATFQGTLSKHIAKNLDEIRHEYQAGREELEGLTNRTFRKVSEVEGGMQIVSKKIYDAFQDVNNNVQTARDEIVYEIRKSTTSSLGELRPVLQQVNQSVAQSVARAAEGLNITLMEEAARRREDSMRSDYIPLQCPDPTTVAALQEVKHLLQSMLKKSEDLRRGLTKQTSEGVDLLKLLHQRFSVLLRRMNTEPDHGQQLVAEMQDLGSLVESSYTAVLVAQNAFIDSCKRIQAEEPTLEHKIAEILDKLVTDINLGHKFNRMQLNELKRLVEHLTDTNGTASGTYSQSESGQEAQEILRNLRDSHELPSEASGKLSEMHATILKIIEAANLTASRLENVEERIEGVSRTLLDIDWSNVRQKEPADQLVTAAKDLKGYARDQIIQSLNLYQALLTTLEQITLLSQSSPDPQSPTDEVYWPSDVDFSFPIYLSDEGHAPIRETHLTLPRACTSALLDLLKSLPEFKRSIPTTPAPPVRRSKVRKSKHGDEEEEYDDDDIPAWYTDPDFLSGNYGTPDLGYPVFREDEWRDMGDYASDDYLFIERTSTPEPSVVTTSAPTTTVAPSTTSYPHRIFPGGVDRFFGFKTTQSKSTSKREVKLTEQLPEIDF
ncbi:myosin-7-like isoform X2 [Palaemon carinicauda]|uniref:myosin-7-like isoform X2 n=1 Tax=Palaemon carinicauda TaxID=392227 RepID=UPI0035B5CF93